MPMTKWFLTQTQQWTFSPQGSTTEVEDYRGRAAPLS
jgi:hypothetical protein